MVNRMRAVGFDFKNPPENPTITQLETFVSSLQEILQLGRRMDAQIKRNNKGKAEIAETLKKEGYQTPSGEWIALQYYAH